MWYEIDFLTLNRQIFHLRSWKVLRTIINRMSLLPTFSPTKSMNITNSIYTIRTLTETAKQSRDAKNIFPSNIVAKSCKCLAKLLKLQEAAGCRLNKTIAGICFSISYPLFFCASRRQDALLCTSCFLKKFYWVQSKYTAFWLKNMYFAPICQQNALDWKWDFNCHEAIKNLFNLVIDICGFCEIPYFMEVKC